MNNLPAADRRVPPSQSYVRNQIIPAGTRFGQWEVIETGISKRYGKRAASQRACRCRCSCPKQTTKVISYYHLKKGVTNSCGCIRKHPLIPIGSKFKYWEVVQNNLYKDWKNQKQRACIVRCECGTEMIRTYGELRRGRTKSCGCRTKERNIKTVWNDLHYMLRMGATRRGIKFHLTLPELKFVTQMPCTYCGREPSNIQRRKYSVDGNYQRGVDPSMEILWSGLDRIDSSKGYLHGNVVPCCKECNRMKMNLPLDDFLALVAQIQQHGPTAEKIQSLAATLFESDS